MKPAIHPTYHSDCQVSCACGNKFTTGSTLEKIEIEVCNKCHPFFTGQHKYVDIKGRIDKFNQKVEQGKTYADTKAAKVAKTAAKKDKKTN